MSPPDVLAEHEWLSLSEEMRAGITFRWLGQHREALTSVQKDISGLKDTVKAVAVDVADIKESQHKFTNGGSNIMVSKRAVLGLFGVGVTAAGVGIGVVQKLIGG